MSAICTAFTKTYPPIDLDLKNSNSKIYDYMILITYILEMDKRFKVKKIYKTTKKGTAVAYEFIKDLDDLQQYKNFVRIKIDEFNNKYGVDFKLNMQ